ncbi:MAG: DNA mismatch repair endonuclease MutL [Thermodesulfobacteriota bacterium]
MIRILNEKVVSQIAAGEVIDRPASAVRELLDNSIDAGASRIHVTMERGGKRCISVSDDGVGMDRDDLLLSVERHATSKIQALPDLFAVKTLGFRGEALPSIAAVSRMQMTSRRKDQLAGHRLKISGGSIKSLEETGCPVGTRVEVKDLFFNTPVRKKFLKGDRTETDHIVDAFMRIALPRIRIHFRLDEGDRTILNLPAADNDRHRLSGFLGRGVADSMIETAYQGEGLKIRIYLAHPQFPRARADRMLFYVNGRHIRDRSLMHAVMEGYGQRLMKGRYPQSVVFMDVEPSVVDVNIHPAKQEVRFEQPRTIHRILTATIQKALGRTSGPASGTGDAYAWPQESPAEDRAEAISESPSIFFGEEAAGPKGGPPQKSFLDLEGLRVLGQLGETYILCEGKDGLLLIDQHAAHERVLYETLRNSYRTGRLETQGFLIPYRMEFSLRDARIVESNIESLRRLGLEMEPFGGAVFVLRSVPVVLVHAPLERMLAEMLPALEEGDWSQERVLDGMVTVMACHGAIRANQVLTHTEISSLVEQLFRADLPTNCPHGRPTMKRLGFDELARMFKRVV